MERNLGNIISPVTIFDMDLGTEEDVDACLAEFVFLVRLDIREDARQLAEHVLWRHIEFFPVFAELSAFFILIQDRQAASDLIVDLAVRRIAFEAPDQQDYVQMVALFARGRLSDSTLTAFSRHSVLEPGYITLDTQYSLFQQIDYTSVAQVGCKHPPRPPYLLPYAARYSLRRRLTCSKTLRLSFKISRVQPTTCSP